MANKRGKRKWFWLLLPAFMIVAGGYLTDLLRPRMDPLPSDAKLLAATDPVLRPVPLPKGKNGYGDFLAAMDKIRGDVEIQRLQPGVYRPDYPLQAEAALEPRAPIFQAIARAAASDYALPERAPADKLPITLCQTLYSIEPIAALTTHNPDAYSKAAIAYLDASQLCMRLPLGWKQMDSATAFYFYALENLEKGVRFQLITPIAARVLIAKLDTDDARRMFETQARTEYWSILLPIIAHPENFRREPPTDRNVEFSKPITGRLDRMATLKIANDYIAAQVKSMDDPKEVVTTNRIYSDVMTSMVPDPLLLRDSSWLSDVTFRYHMLTVPNALGNRILAQNLGLGTLTLRERYLATIDHIVRTRTLLAISIYEQEHGLPPTDLNELVSAGLLKAAPVYPSNKEPLMYKPMNHEIQRTKGRMYDGMF